jgi:hypothetical protein
MIKTKPPTPESFDGAKIKSMTIDEALQYAMPKNIPTINMKVIEDLKKKQRLPRKLKKRLKKTTGIIQAAKNWKHTNVKSSFSMNDFEGLFHPTTAVEIKKEEK